MRRPEFTRQLTRQPPPTGGLRASAAQGIDLVADIRTPRRTCKGCKRRAGDEQARQARGTPSHVRWRRFGWCKLGRTPGYRPGSRACRNRRLATERGIEIRSTPRRPVQDRHIRELIRPRRPVSRGFSRWSTGITKPMMAQSSQAFITEIWTLRRHRIGGRFADVSYLLRSPRKLRRVRARIRDDWQPEGTFRGPANTLAPRHRRRDTDKRPFALTCVSVSCIKLSGL